MADTDGLDHGPVIINAALTGMVPTKDDTPHVPLTPGEVARDAEAVAAAGAAIIHLHPRDPDGLPTTDPEAFTRLIGAVRERCPGVLICATCSGRLEQDIGRRSAALALPEGLRPDLASLTLGSMNFARSASLNAPDTVNELAKRMRDAGVKPELEVFHPGMIGYARYLQRKGMLDSPLYLNLLLGNLGTSDATPLDLGAMVAQLPAGSVWGVAGIGRYQLTVNALSLAAGGHVRVGLEDNIYFDWRDRSLATNAALVERVVRIVAELGRRPATVSETRQMIGLPMQA